MHGLQPAIKTVLLINQPTKFTSLQVLIKQLLTSLHVLLLTILLPSVYDALSIYLIVHLP